MISGEHWQHLCHLQIEHNRGFLHPGALLVHGYHRQKYTFRLW